MTAVVTAEAVALVLLALLVAGLLRSHAEILRRLEELRPQDGERPVAPGIARPEQAGARAADIAGVTPAGDAVQVAVTRSGSRTLVAFLSSGCDVCQGFWSTLGSDSQPALPVPVELLVVTKGGDEESPSRIRELAPATIRTVMSSAAWSDYRVPGSPYFVYVGEDGTVAGEGAARQWAQVVSLFRDALGDAALAADRSRRVSSELEAAGIGPGHPSLYGERGDG